MKVAIDQDLCESQGVCQREAPEVFQLTDDDVTIVLQPTPASDHHEAVRRAAWGCPKQAVIVDEDP